MGFLKIIQNMITIPLNMSINHIQKLRNFIQCKKIQNLFLFDIPTKN